MKILITGGNGFIGKNLKEYLEKKYYVYSPSHQELDLLNGNKVREYLENNNFDIVIHAAVKGGSRKQPTFQDMLKNNLLMFFNIAQNKHLYKRMIFLGSGAEYDKKYDIIQVKEEDFGKKVPDDDYGFYKYICSKYIQSSDNVINLRLFGIFGKYEDYDIRIISNLICRALLNLPIEINQNAVFDFIDIQDFCKIVEYFILNNPKEKFYNIGNGKPIQLIEIANIIKKISGKNFEITLKKHGLNKEYTCNNSKLINEMKKINFTSIEQSIENLFNWYSKNKGNIKKQDLLSY